MKKREPMLPLIVGVIAAVLAHGGLLPWATHWLTGARAKRSSQLDTQPLLPEPKRMELGREAPKTSALAWIPYDDFRKLIAPKSPTEQPTVQQQADPTPNAPLPVDPSAVASAPAALARPETVQSTDHVDAPQQQKEKTTQAQASEEPAEPREQQSPIDEGIDNGQLAVAETGERVEDRPIPNR